MGETDIVLPHEADVTPELSRFAAGKRRPNWARNLDYRSKDLTAESTK